jgi:hypothetical protein
MHELKVPEQRRLAALTLLIATLVVAATASRTAARPSAVAACGSDYWPLKTFSDPLRKKVNLTPKNTTLAAITVQSIRSRRQRRATRRSSFKFGA